MRIRGNGTKDWYGQQLEGEVLDTTPAAIRGSQRYPMSRFPEFQRIIDRRYVFVEQIDGIMRDLPEQSGRMARRLAAIFTQLLIQQQDGVGCLARNHSCVQVALKLPHVLVIVM